MCINPLRDAKNSMKTSARAESAGDMPLIRALAGTVIGALSGGSVLALFTVAEYLDNAHFINGIGDTGLTIVSNTLAGVFVGAVIGGPIAFAVLITVLRESNPWRALPILTLGASLGSALQFGVANALWQHTTAAQNAVLIYVPLGATVGGTCAAYWQRRRARLTTF